MPDPQIITSLDHRLLHHNIVSRLVSVIFAINALEREIYLRYIGNVGDMLDSKVVDPLRSTEQKGTHNLPSNSHHSGSLFNVALVV